MHVVKADDVAESLERIEKILAHVRSNGQVYLQFFGSFTEVDATRILFSSVTLSIANPETGDLDEYEAYVPCVERHGESLHCLVQPRQPTFAFHRLPAKANAQGVVTNLAYVVVDFGTKKHPRMSAFAVGIRIQRRPQAI